MSMTPGTGEFLSRIKDPADLRKLDADALPALCEEIRQFIIEMLSAHPGHLGASLGAVEIAVAIHYIFDTPYDKVIWDVGHQAYAHKILTGRKDIFDRNRINACKKPSSTSNNIEGVLNVFVSTPGKHTPA